jgi:hypothetical protein
MSEQARFYPEYFTFGKIENPTGIMAVITRGSPALSSFVAAVIQTP